LLINDFIGKSKSTRLPDGRLQFAVSDYPLQGSAKRAQVLEQALSAEASDTLSCWPASDAENHAGVDVYVDCLTRRAHWQAR
jgi:hypothetical protein